MKPPSRVEVCKSGRDKLDGVYKRIQAKSQDKPCYMKGTKKDPMYFYWLSGKWKLGNELGGHKSFASAKDVKDKSKQGHPCDPSHKYKWKCFDKESSDFKEVPDMQVIVVKVTRTTKPAKPTGSVVTNASPEKVDKVEDASPEKVDKVEEKMTSEPVRADDDMPVQPESVKSEVAAAPSVATTEASNEGKLEHTVSVNTQVDERPPSVIKFENYLRTVLTSSPVEQRRSKFDLIMSKVSAHRNNAHAELAFDVATRIQEEFGIADVKDNPSPKRQCLMTPPKNDLPRSASDTVPHLKI